MREELVRDFSGRIIGKYVFKTNGDIVVRDFGGRILGYYKSGMDVTTDFSGRIIARGNAIGMLLSRH